MDVDNIQPEKLEPRTPKLSWARRVLCSEALRARILVKARVDAAEMTGRDIAAARRVTDLVAGQASRRADPDRVRVGPHFGAYTLTAEVGPGITEARLPFLPELPAVGPWSALQWGRPGVGEPPATRPWRDNSLTSLVGARAAYVHPLVTIAEVACS